MCFGRICLVTSAIGCLTLCFQTTAAHSLPIPRKKLQEAREEQKDRLQGVEKLRAISSNLLNNFPVCFRVFSVKKCEHIAVYRICEVVTAKLISAGFSNF